MKVFAAVAKNMSFTEAAFELGISQSAVSQMVQALERELGVELVVRNRRKIALTPAGSFFARESKRIVEEVEQLVEDVRSSKFSVRKSLRIAYLNVFRGNELQRAIARFSAINAGVVFDVSSISHEEIYEKLRTG